MAAKKEKNKDSATAKRKQGRTGKVRDKAKTADAVCILEEVVLNEMACCCEDECGCVP